MWTICSILSFTNLKALANSFWEKRKLGFPPLNAATPILS